MTPGRGRSAHLTALNAAGGWARNDSASGTTVHHQSRSPKSRYGHELTSFCLIFTSGMRILGLSFKTLHTYFSSRSVKCHPSIKFFKGPTVGWQERLKIIELADEWVIDLPHVKPG